MVLFLTERFCNVIAEKRKIRKKEETGGGVEEVLIEGVLDC